MNIIKNIEIVSFYIHPFIKTYTEIPYIRNGKSFVRKVKLKSPIAAYRISFNLIGHDESIKLGGVYIDDKGFKWLCVNRNNLYGNMKAELRPINMVFPENFYYIPKEISLISLVAL
jgi:hypothetical protein